MKEEVPSFESNIRNDPLELLEHVEILMHVPQRAKYSPLTLVEVLMSFLRLRQGENESLLDYLGRFKSETKVVTRLFGKKLVDDFVENKKEYRDLPKTDIDAKKSLKEKEWDKFKVVLFLQNADTSRFGEMLVDFRKQLANNKDNYPADIQTMVDVMRQQPERKKRPAQKPQPKK